MDLNPDETQLELAGAVADYCDRRLTTSRLRQLIDAPSGDSSLWAEIAELGVFDLRRDQAEGGLGLGMAEAALVFEGLGRALAPGPIVDTHLAHTLLSTSFPDGLPHAATSTTVGFSPLLIPHLDQADVVVVIRPDSLALVGADEMSGTAVSRPLDPLTPLHILADEPHGRSVAGPDFYVAWTRQARILTAAIQVGIASAVLDHTVKYTITREQFGRPLGANQALKHRMADMHVRTVVARAAVLAAAANCDDPEAEDLDRAANSAKVLADAAAVENGKAAVQLHGGMGFTWETDVHLYLKRAWVNSQSAGTSDECSELLAGQLLADARP